ncbi:MAG: nucleotidyltransferase domain-containing protein [Thermoanaerobaculaceae bacterium]|nr:nucleotidyltransferase domain-containing protein [Thermoanaerobaculaceae bacterium]
MADRAPVPTFTIAPQTLPGPLGRVVERYVRAFAPERIVLFGSRAKGTDREESDADLLVIADLEGDPASHLRRAHQLAADCFPPVDVVFATSEEVAAASAADSPFLLSILGSGVTVYRRPEGVRSRQAAAG